MGWITGLAVVALALVLVLVIVMRPWSTPAPSQPTAPTATSQVSVEQVCAERSPEPDPDVPSSNGRVQSGKLSYPKLAAPFGPPTRTTLMQFSYLSDVASQFAILRYHGQSTGGAEVMIARLPLIDGFSTPRQTAGLLIDCVAHRLSGAAEIGRRSGPETVDGRQAWMVRTHLGYGAVEAGVKSATIIVLVVAVTDAENGLFYAYLPDTHPELIPRAEQALKQLEVR